jgi:hypothetical protein
MRKPQQGISIVGFLLLLAVIGFFAYTAMLLIPAYMEYFGVVKAMKAVVDDTGTAALPIEQIRRKFDFNSNLQYVGDKTVPPSAIKLNTQGNMRTLQIVYDKEIPFVYNISLLLHFQHSEKLDSEIAGF